MDEYVGFGSNCAVSGILTGTRLDGGGTRSGVASYSGNGYGAPLPHGTGRGDGSHVRRTDGDGLGKGVFMSDTCDYKTT